MRRSQLLPVALIGLLFVPVSAEETSLQAKLEALQFSKVLDLPLFPEGPSYDPHNDRYVFSGNNALSLIDRSGSLQILSEKPGGGGTHVLPDGSILVVGKFGLRRFYPDGRVALLADGAETGGGNDLTIGKRGEIYFSAPGRGIYRLTPGTQGKLSLVTSQGANGLDVDPSGEWLYVAAGGIQRHQIHGFEDSLGDRELVCELPEGEAGGDGCTFDQDGNFYTVHFRTGTVRVINVQAKQLVSTIPTSV
ncbi:MAG: SMP-30/gluconolactonase/LRE family protein [Verrucomicrobiota bacterium]